VVQPNLLILDAHHPLLDGYVEHLGAAAAVVVAPDQAYVGAADQPAVVCRLLPAAHAEVAHDPQHVALVHVAVDGVEQFLVVAAYRLVAHAPAAARVRPRQAFLLGVEVRGAGST